jgi:hypothetical protein
MLGTVKLTFKSPAVAVWAPGERFCDSHAVDPPPLQSGVQALSPVLRNRNTPFTVRVLSPVTAHEVLSFSVQLLEKHPFGYNMI